MKVITNMHTKVGIVLAMTLSMRALSFAGNTVGDVPASANENRTIQHETTLYTDTCDITQNLVFYEKSPVYLRVAQPKGQVSYVFDKVETYVRMYGTAVFGPNIKFPYVSNFVPSTTVDPGTTPTILTVDTTGGLISGGAVTTPRGEISAQLITKNNERSIITNTNGVNLVYYYKWASDFTNHTNNLKVIINPSLTTKTACTNYYVARCGDGTLDKPTGSSEGNGGMMIPVEGFKGWHSRSIKPDEQCDEGTLNGTPGHCNATCSGMGSGTVVVTGAAGCTITASTSSITAGNPVTITASYTSGATASLTPTLSGLSTFTYPNWNGNTIDTPTTTTTYTLTVQGITGVTNNSCTTTVTVTPPAPHLSCTLSLSPSVSVTGQIISVGWNITGGTFQTTWIYVTPPGVRVGGSWPHMVPANIYNGLNSVQPIQTGDYTFSMTVQGVARGQNTLESTSCTGILHVVNNVPSTCSLTTTTPIIMPGQAAILNASYTNTTLATMTPNIVGLNFIYPNRSNTNISVYPTSSTTYTLNTLGIGGSGGSCSTKIIVINTGVTITKTLLANVPYHSGELVSFKISFANNGPSTVNNVVLSDYLPAGLEYVNSQLFGASPYTFGTGINGGNEFVEYSGFSLIPGQQGYMLIQGRFKGYQYTNQTLNNAFLKADETVLLYAAALFNVYTPSGNASVVKTSDKASYYPGEDARFTIAVTNNGPDAITNAVITDDRPNTTYITPDTQWTSNVPLTMSNTTDPYTWTYNGSLAVGQTIYLYITGHITNTSSSIGSYVNNSSIVYTINGNTQTGNAAGLNFAVSTTPSSTMNFEKRLIQYGNNAGSSVTFELLYQNNGSATITSYDIVDYWPGTLDFVSANPMPTTQTPSSGGMLLHWIFNAPLAPNGSGKITINGTVH